MTADKITSVVVDALEELKAANIKVLDVANLTTITDVMIIASGRSSRQVKSIADKVMEKTRAAGIPLLGVEGHEQSEWVLVDLGDVIVHIMHPDTRTYYQLEKLWDPNEQSRNVTTST